MEELQMHLFTSRGVVRAVDGVTLHVTGGEMVGLVGESGCGKTMLARCFLRLIPDAGRVVSGRVLVRDRDLMTMDADAVRQIRGCEVALSVQDPMSALDPVMRIGAQVREAMTVHGRRASDARGAVVSLLDRVQIPAPDQRARHYAHQLSGGMRQRVLIAMGIANTPALLVADEATTALDASAQTQMLRLLEALNEDVGAAVMLITHNLALVAEFCDRVLVMYAGQIVEEGPVEEIFENPQHPYTWQLLNSLPRIDRPRASRLVTIDGSPPDLAKLPGGCRFHPRCPFREDRCLTEEPPLEAVGPAHRARCWILMKSIQAPNAASSPSPAMSPGPSSQAVLKPAISRDEPIMRIQGISKHFGVPSRGLVKAVDDVTLDIYRGEALGLIGESGCGKSTLGALMVLLLAATSGRVVFEGEALDSRRRKKLHQLRRRVQMVFQDPVASLDPRMTIADIIAEPLDNHQRLPRTQRGVAVEEALEAVGLRQAVADQYPHELSGGQRQRVGIARAIILRPSLIICDEPIAALDVSIQAQIVNLLHDLRAQYHLTLLFISHDLTVVRHLCDRVAVMYLGKIVEVASTEDLFIDPQHPYTRALLDAMPIPIPRRRRDRNAIPLAGEVPSPLNAPSGCSFHPRCRLAVTGFCDLEKPELRTCGAHEHVAACHFAGFSHGGKGAE
ncbi:MAG: dipeptide ABC transporter ATP-binding protein [Acidimicrobiales bacterium]